MKPLNIILIVLGVITFGCLLFIGGCYGMIRYMVHCRSCNFDIDNTELITSVDVRLCRDVWCQYNDTTLTKTSVYCMDIPRKDVDSYLVSSGLSKIQDALPHFTSMSAWNDSIEKLPVTDLFIKQDTTPRFKWLLIFDSSTTTLWAEIREMPGDR